MSAPPIEDFPATVLGLHVYTTLFKWQLALLALSSSVKAGLTSH